LAQLREGNGRFVNDGRVVNDLTSRERRSAVSGGQEPFAIVLGCADARVPAEIIFDHGLGDLFVIRVAGNVVAPSGVGSIEFAAERFGTRLVVVLGHSRCGAVVATLEELERPTENRSPNLSSIVDRIRPAVEPLLANGAASDPEALLQQAVHANIAASVEQLRHGSTLLEELQRTDGLRVVGAEYCLESGTVEFHEGG
jgi:carbonic anhydrase